MPKLTWDVCIVLALRIQNATVLPDGGPLGITIEGTRGIDIGRDQHLDWTLPDTSRFISGRHCEIRWHDDAYWLHDVSTNGTFLDGEDRRLKAPHKLRDGDRFSVGHYVILANVSAGAAPVAASSMVEVEAPYENIWDPVGEAAPPIDPRRLRAPRDLQPVKPDFLDWAIDLPPAAPDAPPSRNDAPPRERAIADSQVDSWSEGARPPVMVAPSSEVATAPTPRRPVWVTGEPDGLWAAPPAAVSPSAAPALGQQNERPRGSHADQGATDILALIASGAGLPADAFAHRDPAELAQELGQLVRAMVENTRSLLEGRLQAKRFARSSSQTSVQALDNNPLKFAPTADEAMRIMFGPATRSYLDARKAVGRSFDDLKSHQIKTFSAMQHALKRLLQEFDPVAIEQAVAPGGRLAGVLGSSKAKAWDTYVARWQAHTHRDEDGLLNAYMRYFAEYYDRDDNAE
jgi:type VI secretion system protein ImpI